AQKVLNDYGFKRVNYVLANTIQMADWDGRYGASNKEWAKRIFVPPDETNGYFALNAHPCIIENFVNQTRARPRKLHIFRFRRARERRKLTRSAARPLSSARLRARRSRHVAPLPFAFSRRIFRARRGDEDKFDVENRHRPAAVRRHARQPSEAVVERKGGTAE
ncbi:MAG: DUF3849 domain-containing protein, partial [Oscillospiraceae bacterium]|nr:DUF3849 domain-containing protein [Oscillospiraceae bacterium]